MQMMIDIPETVIENIENSFNYGEDVSKYTIDTVLDSITTGTPIPKGHGRLIDAERLQEVFRRNIAMASAFDDLLRIAPTIIEADTGV